MALNLWVDDFRNPPAGFENYFVIARSTNQALAILEQAALNNIPLGLVAIDHDAGAYQPDGGDFMKVMDWLEERRIPNLTVMVLTSNSYVATVYYQIIANNRNIGWRDLSLDRISSYAF